MLVFLSSPVSPFGGWGGDGDQKVWRKCTDHSFDNLFSPFFLSFSLNHYQVMAMDVVDQVWFSRQGPRSCNQSNWNLSRFRNSLKSQSSYVFNSKSCTDFKMFELWSFSLQCLTSSYCTEEKLQKMHEQSFPNKKPIENAGTHLDLCVFSKFGIFWSCENAPRNIREKIVIFHYNWPCSDQPYYRSDGTKSKWQISSLSHNCQPTCQIVFLWNFPTYLLFPRLILMGGLFLLKSNLSAKLSHRGKGQ